MVSSNKSLLIKLRDSVLPKRTLFSASQVKKEKSNPRKEFGTVNVVID